MATGPIAPIFSGAPHLVCPVGPLSAWFIDPPGAVVQLTEATEFNVEMARWLAGAGYDALIERFQVRSGLFLLLDIRPMTSRAAAVRTTLMDKAREDAATFARVVIVPPLQINPVYLTTLTAAAAFVSAFGTQLEISSKLEELLAHDGIKPIG